MSPTTRARRRRLASVRRLATAVVAATATAALAACGQLPIDGPVQAGRTEVPAASTVQLGVSRPVAGDSPTEIVRGFIANGAAGVSGDADFEVARSFLTASASNAWTPLAEVIVSANDEQQTIRIAGTAVGPEREDGEQGDAPGSADGEGETADGGDPDGTGTGTDPAEGHGEGIDDPDAGSGTDLDDGVDDDGVDPEVDPGVGGDPSAPSPSASIPVEEADRVTVTVGVVAVGDVDAQGVYTPSTSRTTSELSYDLVRVEGEWRIDALPEGLLLTEATFGLVFPPVQLAFLTPDATTFVPDVRYVPARNAPSHAVALLLGGPAPWLVPAVTTRVPSGLVIDTASGGVSVDAAGEVAVHLGATTVPAAQRDLLYAQLRQTLLGITGVRDMTLWLGAAPYEPASETVLPVEAPAVPDRLVASAGGTLVTVTPDGLVPIGDPAPTSDESTGDTGDTGDTEDGDETGGTEGTGGDPTASDGDATVPDDSTDTPVAPEEGTGLWRPAPAYVEEDGIAALQGDDLVHVSPDGAITVLSTAVDPIPPSQDPQGWIWSGERQGQLTATRPDGTESLIAADHLAGSLVREVRISRDGVRAVVLRESEDAKVWLEAAAVVRDSSGAPTALLPGPTLGAFADGLGVVWVDASTVAVLAQSEIAGTAPVRVVTVGGPTSVVSSPAQAATLAAGNGLSQLYVATSDGRLLARTSLRWEEVASGVADPAFPG